MTSPELANYISSQRSLGLNDDQIKQALLNNGWKKEDVDQAFSEMTTPTPPLPVGSIKTTKFRIFGTIGIVLGIIALLPVPFMFFGSFLGFIFSADGGGDAVLHKGLPLFLVPLIWLLIGLGLVINSIRLFKVRPGQSFILSKFQKIFWPAAILGAIALYWFATSFQPSVKSLNTSNIPNTTNNASAEDTRIANFINESFPEWYKSLDDTSRADLVMAYKVLHMLYEKPAPKSSQEYYQYAQCANSIIDSVIAKNPTTAPQPKYTSDITPRYFDIYMAFQKKIDDEVGFNKSLDYGTALGGQVFDGSEYAANKMACGSLNIPLKYK